MLLAADACIVYCRSEWIPVSNRRYRHFLIHCLALTGNMHSGVLVSYWLLNHHTSLNARSSATEYIYHGVRCEGPSLLIKLWILYMTGLSIGYVLWLRGRGFLVVGAHGQAGISSVFIVLDSWRQARAIELTVSRRYVHHTRLWLVILHLIKWVYTILLHVCRAHVSLKRHWIELFHVDHLCIEPAVVRVLLFLIMISLKKPILIW